MQAVLDRHSNHTEATTPDAELIHEHINGHDDAFERILLRHRERLWMVVRRYVHNHSDAEEVLQEALLKASEKLDTFRGEAALLTWLHRLVVNTAYDFVHRTRDIPTIPLDPELLHAQPSRMMAYDPCNEFVITSTVRQAMAELPQDQQRAIYLVDFAGVDIAVAAAIEGVRPGTMKSRRSRARAALRRSLYAFAHA